VNPYFFMTVPLLGEIKWTWFWSTAGYTPGMAHPPGTFPHTGYYRIDILDVVKCTSSYSHRGDGAYDPVYFPGADLSATDLCHVGILALVSITGKYFETYGSPVTWTLGANSVGLGGSATATWTGTPTGTGPAIWPTGSLAVHFSGNTVTATLNAGFENGSAYWYPTGASYTNGAWIVLDSKDPMMATSPAYSFEVLQAAGATTAQTTWPGLVGGTITAGPYSTYETCTLSTSNGLVENTPVTGYPVHYAWGWYKTSGGVLESFDSIVG
jgi:hypothetical protein